MIYELLVGKVPFTADTPFAIVHDHIYTPLPLPRTINPGLSESTERVLLKALAKDKEDRYSNVSSMIEALKGSITSSSLGSTVKKVKSPKPSVSELTGGTIGNTESTAVVKKPAIQQPTKQPGSNRKLVLWLVGIMAAALMVTFVVLLVIFLPKLLPADEIVPTLAPTVAITEPAAAVVVDTHPYSRTRPRLMAAVKRVATLPFEMTPDQVNAWELLIKAVCSTG